MAEEYEKLAVQEGTTKSELFRKMIHTYKTHVEDEEFFRVQRRMASRVRKEKALTEREVERIVFEDR